MTTALNSLPPVAIVTGGLQGLGLSIAKHLINSGFNIAIIDLAETSDLPAQLNTQNKNDLKCNYYQLDIANLSQHSVVLEQIYNDFGRLDCLVNNAGIAARPLTDILSLEPEAFTRSLEVNLTGTFFLTQKFAKILVSEKTNNQGTYRSIINITSIAAELVSIERSQYCISKSALSMSTKLFASRLAKEDIHVHEIRPGFMQTAMTESVGNSTIESYLQSGFVPIPRWGQSSDVGKTVSALASGSLPYMTGQAIWVAGGLNLSPTL